MHKKPVFIIFTIITAVIGFSIGFFATKSIAISKEDVIDTSLVSINQKELKIEELSKEDIALIIKNLVINPCPSPKKEYKDESLLDVGQGVGLSDTSYTSSDLILLDKSISMSNICLRKNTSEAVKLMIGVAKADGYKIKVSSGFRNYDTQEIILNRNLKNNNQTTSIAVAKPGHSEHQLGTTVDLTGLSISYATASGKFAQSIEAKWLEENASKYGFIESYPKGKEDTTGYMYEPWHYRYVGIENAKEIIKSGQTINEFLKMKKEVALKNKPTL